MEHWQRLTVRQVMQKLKATGSAGRTHVSVGHGRHAENNVFKIPHMSFKDCILSVISDAVLPLILITAAIAAFLGRHWQSLAIFIVILLSCILATLIKHVSRSMCERLESNMLPTAHVVGEHSIKDIKCTQLFPGDIIALSGGDVVPADARIISADGLSVLEYSNEPGTTTKKFRREYKDANRVYGENEEYETYENLLYAGSAVSTGNCRAVVIAIGDDTRASMLYSGINLLPEHDMPKEYYSLKKAVRPVGIVMLIAVIPITLIGLITSGGAGMGLLDIFTLALAVAVGIMSEQTLSSSEFIISSGLNMPSASETVSVAPAVSQPAAVGKLAIADTAVIFSNSIFCDTSVELRAAYRAGKTYFDVNTQSGALLPLAELIAISKLSHDGTSKTYDVINKENAISRYTAAMNINRLGVMSGIRSLTTRNDIPIPGAVSTVIEREYINDAVGAHREVVCVSDKMELITSCRRYRAEDGTLKKLTSADYDAVFDVCRGFINRCLDIIIYASSQSAASGLILEGVIGVGQAFPERNAQALKEAKAEGLDTILIIEGESAQECAYARCCGLAADDSEIAFASEFLSDGRSICDGVGLYRIYCGFGTDGAITLLTELEHRGKHIIRVADRSGQLRSSIAGQAVCAVNHSSDSTVRVCAELFIDPAAVANDTDQSGLDGIIEAVRRSRACLTKLRILRDYLLFASAMRISAVLLPLFLHKSDIIPPVLCVLICGLFLDLFAVLIMSKYRMPLYTTADFSPKYKGTIKNEVPIAKRKLITALSYTLCGAMAGALIMIVSTSAASLLPSGNNGIPFLTFLSILTTWYAGLFTVSYSEIGSPAVRHINPAMVLTALILALTGSICALVPLSRLSLTLGTWPTFMPILSLLPALTSIALIAVSTIIAKRIIIHEHHG